MHEKPTKPEQQSPADIAREAFRRLAARRIVPTPEAYREAYDEVAGIREPLPAEKILTDLAASLTKAPGELATYSRRFSDSLKTRDWESYGKQLNQLIEKHLVPPKRAEVSTTADKAIPENAVANPPTKTASIPLVDDIAPPVRKISIPLVDDIEPTPARSAAIPLVDTPSPEPIHAEPVLDTPATQFNDTQVTRTLREMLVRTLTLPVPALLQDAKELVQESESLASAINSARSRQTLFELEPRFKQLCFRIEMESGDVAEERELLLRLFRLLIENIGELVDDDAWLSGQIANVRDIISGPINYAVLLDATRSMKEVIYKQSLLKHSLSEAKSRVKDMTLAVIERLGATAASTDGYHKKIELYSQQINQAKGAAELNVILDHLMQDTRIAQIDVQRSHDDVVAARQEVETAEARIHQLEAELKQMSELAHEDQLTGSLNRRGLDEVLAREMARSERKKTPLCVALIDLDNFKKLNDTHGHGAGDGALIHLVRVVKEALRAMDVIARFGGEEFLIVLPHTPLDDAVQTVTRIQRELTKQIFMHENQRLLITFSAGVAMCKENESQVELIARADEAMYRAKKAGKNRVFSAE